MYKNIDDFLGPFVPILEVMVGMDSILVDHEGLLMGLYKRTKDFMNIKNTRLLRVGKENYEALNSKGKPFKNAFLFYIGMEKESFNYKRSEYGLFDLISNAGGFIGAIYKTFAVIVIYVC